MSEPTLTSLGDKMDTMLSNQRTHTQILTGGDDPEKGLIYKQMQAEGKLKGLRQHVDAEVGSCKEDIDEIKSKDRQRTAWLAVPIIGVFINSLFDIFKRGG